MVRGRERGFLGVEEDGEEGLWTRVLEQPSAGEALAGKRLQTEGVRGTPGVKLLGEAVFRGVLQSLTEVPRKCFRYPYRQRRQRGSA